MKIALQSIGHGSTSRRTQWHTGVAGPIPRLSSRPPFQRSMGTPANRPPPRRVDHTYRDYSNFPVCELPLGKKVSKHFPSKLHQILSTPEYSHIISWMPHGRAWKIHNKDLFMREIVPKYFAQSKYESFTRQLNGWGFKRLHQAGNDYNAYYHQCFISGLGPLTVLMKRVAPNNMGRVLPHVEGEPNFYEIDNKFPLPAPVMPYHGHIYSPDRMIRADYWAPLQPEPPTFVGSNHPSHHSLYPSTHPSPRLYNPGHYTATDFSFQQDYPHYPNHPTQYSQPPHGSHHHCPYSHIRSYEHPSRYDSSLQMNQYNHVASSGVPLSVGPGSQDQGLVQEPNFTDGNGKEGSLESLDSFAEAESTTTQSNLITMNKVVQDCDALW